MLSIVDSLSGAMISLQAKVSNCRLINQGLKNRNLDEFTMHGCTTQ